MAPYPPTNHYAKLEKQIEHQHAEAVKWAHEAAASPAVNVIAAPPFNWRLALIVVALLVVGIVVSVGVVSIGRRVLKRWHGTKSNDIEAAVPPVFVPPVLLFPPRASMRGPPVSRDRGYISQADLLAGKGHRKPS
ncbi:hypothetical protein B0H19DRAFT_1384718 [Mycena capillaripes]|nr:hypothetical protein B0H19DRAFT_1384718 [Mycena capillaripes]